MKRMFSSSNLHSKAMSVGEYNILDEYPLIRAPSKPPRTFSRVRGEKRALNVVSADDSFDVVDDDCSSMTAVIAKSVARLDIKESSSTRASPPDSSCLREWVLRMCLLEKLERTALVVLDIEKGADAVPEEWMGAKMADLMEPSKKKRGFCRKFFRNLSPSRLMWKGRYTEAFRTSRRSTVGKERRKICELRERGR